jgi:hypothetical protein
MALDRCEMWGKPKEPIQGHDRCGTCRERYDVYECASCGKRVAILKTISHSELCSACNTRRKMEGLTVTYEQWTEIDARILARNILPALKLIVEQCGIGLGEARDILAIRYQRLRTERPGEFVCTEEEYWRGYYS